LLRSQGGRPEEFGPGEVARGGGKVRIDKSQERVIPVLAIVKGN